MEYFNKNKGRVFVLRMEKGDLLRESLKELCIKENILDAVVLSGIATFDITNIQVANTKGFPIEYDKFSIDKPVELASLDGTIINGEVHVHGSIGTNDKTISGHLLDGCRILYLGEIVIEELTGNELIRKTNSNGVSLIYQK